MAGRYWNAAAPRVGNGWLFLTKAKLTRAKAAAFRPSEHIRRRADFEAIYEGGARVNGRLMTLFVRKNAGEQARLGIAATRKIGSAVVRNRAKRVARELFRHHKPATNLDIVVIPRREFLDASYPSLEREFCALLERVRLADADGSGRGSTQRASSQPRRPRRSRSASRV
jgi:ribonuclease P protein component